jgi:Protein of unknown function (DUF3106)
MAKRQSGVVAQAFTNTANKKMQWSLGSLLLLAFLWSFVSVAQANNQDSLLLAMGDVGAIRSNLSEGEDTPQVMWTQLSDEQKKVLAPLSSEWDTLRPWQREKMLDIARDYPKMDAKKQERVQKRLNSWSRMTPYERENARQRYQQFHSLSPEKKDELRKKWAEHKKSKKESSEVDYDPELD